MWAGFGAAGAGGSCKDCVCWPWDGGYTRIFVCPSIHPQAQSIPIDAFNRNWRKDAAGDPCHARLSLVA